MGKRKYYNHSLTTRFPSKGCKQRLSPEELELRTQENRMRRFAKRQTQKQAKTGNI